MKASQSQSHLSPLIASSGTTLCTPLSILLFFAVAFRGLSQSLVPLDLPRPCANLQRESSAGCTPTRLRASPLFLLPFLSSSDLRSTRPSYAVTSSSTIIVFRSIHRHLRRQFLMLLPLLLDDNNTTMSPSKQSILYRTMTTTAMQRRNPIISSFRSFLLNHPSA